MGDTAALLHSWKTLLVQAPDSTAAVLPSSGVLLGGMLNASFVQIFEPLAASVGWSGGRGESRNSLISAQRARAQGPLAHAPYGKS